MAAEVALEKYSRACAKHALICDTLVAFGCLPCVRRYQLVAKS